MAPAVAATISKRISSVSATWIAPPATENGVMPKSVWFNRSSPRAIAPVAVRSTMTGISCSRSTPFSFTATRTDGLRPNAGRCRRTQCDGGELFTVEHCGPQHVVTRASPRVIRHRCSEPGTGRRARLGQVDIEAFDGQRQLERGVRRRAAEPDGARLARRRDDVVVPEFCQGPGPADDDGDDGLRRVDLQRLCGCMRRRRCGIRGTRLRGIHRWP